MAISLLASLSPSKYRVSKCRSAHLLTTAAGWLFSIAVAFGLFFASPARAWTITASPVWYKYTDIAAEHGGEGEGWELSDRSVYAEYWDERYGGSSYQRIYFEMMSGMEIGNNVGSGFVAVRIHTGQALDIYIGLDDTGVFRDVTDYINHGNLVHQNWMAAGYVGGTLNVPDSFETKTFGSSFVVKSTRMDWRSDFDNGGYPAYEMYAHAIVRTYYVSPTGNIVSAPVMTNQTNMVGRSFNELGTWTIRKQVATTYQNGWLSFDHDYVVGTVNVVPANTPPRITAFSAPSVLGAGESSPLNVMFEDSEANAVALRVWRNGEAETDHQVNFSPTGNSYAGRTISLPVGEHTFSMKVIDSQGAQSTVVQHTIQVFPIKPTDPVVTNIRVQGVDLISIFKRRQNQSRAPNTGFTFRHNGITYDLADLFMPRASAMRPSTGYNAVSGVDLSSIFETQ